MHKYSMKDVSDGMEAILRDPRLRAVTVFCQPLDKPKQSVRVARNGKGTASFTLSLGLINSGSRKHLKKHLKAGHKVRMRFQYYRDTKKK